MTIQKADVAWVRIYMTSRERYKQVSWGRRLAGFVPYEDLVREAKRVGLLTGVVQTTPMGFAGSSTLQDDHSEMPNPYRYVTVDLLGEAADLERFVVDHPDLLTGKVMVQLNVEQWMLTA